MIISLVNYRYFVSGGPERYLFNLKNSLELEGHSVVPFSINFPQNLSSEYSDYFVMPPGGGVYFSKKNLNLNSAIKNLERSFYSIEVENAYSRLLNDKPVDIVYVLHYLRKLSPAVLVAAKKKNLPVVVRLSDYQMLCPQAHFLRNGVHCDKCLGGNQFNSVIHKCVKDSFVASVVNFLSVAYHKYKSYYSLVDKFVLTNQFMMNSMLSAGWDKDKLLFIPTFASDGLFVDNNLTKQDGKILYSGRLDASKGVDLIIKAMAVIANDCPNAKLFIAGDGDPDYVKYLKSLAAECNVVFLGSLDMSDLSQHYATSQVTVVPSQWVENLPNSLIESMACGTPVIATDIGSLSYFIDEGVNGFKFARGDYMSLARAVLMVLSNSNLSSALSGHAKHYAFNNFSQEKHMEKLLNIFDQLIK